MDRIIPYGYPTIPGGASGGASVDPTPPSSDDPQPGVSTPYNLDDMTVVPKGLSDNCNQVANVFVGKPATAEVYIFKYLTVQGVIPVDLTGVKQIKLETPLKSDDSFILTADGVSVKDKITAGNRINRTYSISEFANGDLFVDALAYYFSKDNWNSYLKDKQILFSCPMEITVYNTAGEIMQQETVEVKL